MSGESVPHDSSQASSTSSSVRVRASDERRAFGCGVDGAAVVISTEMVVVSVSAGDGVVGGGWVVVGYRSRRRAVFSQRVGQRRRFDRRAVGWLWRLSCCGLVGVACWPGTTACSEQQNRNYSLARPHITHDAKVVRLVGLGVERRRVHVLTWAAITARPSPSDCRGDDLEATAVLDPLIRRPKRVPGYWRSERCLDRSPAGELPALRSWEGFDGTSQSMHPAADRQGSTSPPQPWPPHEPAQTASTSHVVPVQISLTSMTTSETAS